MQIEHSEFQDQLVRGLAHRMNNILTLFHGYIGLLLDTKRLDKGTLDGLGKIQDGAKSACDLMDRANAIVRSPKIVWREVKLGDFVRMLKPSLDTLRGPTTKLVINVADDLPPIQADAARVKTAIFEIARNALESTHAGGTVRIEVRSEPQPAEISGKADSAWVAVRVIDDGPGIPGGTGDRVYQPFFTTKKKHAASGLGLTITAGIAAQHGGLLRYESEPGNTVFQLLLPCRPAQCV